MKLKALLLFTCLLFTLSLRVYARIGETPEECVKRYGTPDKIMKDEQKISFIKSGLLIIVHFYQTKADAIAYRKVSESILGQAEELSDNEIQTLLNSNTSGITWKEMQMTSIDSGWQTEDSNTFAIYGSFDHVLTIMSKDFMIRMHAEKKAKEDKDLNGF